MEPVHNLPCIAHVSNGNGTVFRTESILLFYIFFQFQTHDKNPMKLIVIGYEGVYSFGLLFISCETCHQLSNAFEECGETFDQFTRYAFPVNIQRNMPLVINFGQQPVEFYCFGSIACTRDTYKRVRSN